ncbi:hypothetical protein BYT27DRAFT_7262937 [Phlegmacium glaucopus]|nr:hypothetical protein BYT27DRAFT_7262937 [Phlegmacium glaucopus]
MADISFLTAQPQVVAVVAVEEEVVEEPEEAQTLSLNLKDMLVFSLPKAKIYTLFNGVAGEGVRLNELKLIVDEESLLIEASQNGQPCYMHPNGLAYLEAL